MGVLKQSAIPSGLTMVQVGLAGVRLRTRGFENATRNRLLLGVSRVGMKVAIWEVASGVVSALGIVAVGCGQRAIRPSALVSILEQVGRRSTALHAETLSVFVIQVV